MSVEQSQKNKGDFNNQNGIQNVNVFNGPVAQIILKLDTATGDYIKQAKEEIIELFEPIIEKLIQNELNDYDKRKISKLGFEYCSNSIDMEESIKYIYKQCFKVCAYNLRDEIKYKTIRNLIDIINKITIYDLDDFKKLVQKRKNPMHQRVIGHYPKNYLPMVKTNNVTNRMKSLGLVSDIIDYFKTDNNIKDQFSTLARGIDQQKRNESYSRHSHSLESSIRPLQDFIKMSLYLTYEGELLAEILNMLDDAEIAESSIINIVESLNEMFQRDNSIV